MNYVYIDKQALDAPLTCEVAVTTDRDEKGPYHEVEIVAVYAGDIDIIDAMDQGVLARMTDRAHLGWPHGFEHDAGELETM